MREKFLDLSEAEGYLGLNWDGYRAGSESCVHLLPDGENPVLPDIPEGKLRTLVTPITGPSGLERVLDLAIRAHENGWEEIVANDWGVLRELCGVAGKKVTAGRLLMRFRRGPGMGDPWQHLDDGSRKYFAWGPLYDGPFLHFLAEMGIERLEADSPRHWHPLPGLAGFKVSLHANTRMISVSSQCPWLYHPGMDGWSTPERCSRDCLRSGPVLLHSEHLDGPLVQRGMEILEDASGSWKEKDLPPEVDRLIYTHEPVFGTLNAYTQKI